MSSYVQNLEHLLQLIVADRSSSSPELRTMPAHKRNALLRGLIGRLIFFAAAGGDPEFDHAIGPDLISPQGSTGFHNLELPPMFYDFVSKANHILLSVDKGGVFAQSVQTFWHLLEKSELFSITNDGTVYVDKGASLTWQELMRKGANDMLAGKTLAHHLVTNMFASVGGGAQQQQNTEAMWEGMSYACVTLALLVQLLGADVTLKVVDNHCSHI